MRVAVRCVVAIVVEGPVVGSGIPVAVSDDAWRERRSATVATVVMVIHPVDYSLEGRIRIRG